MSLYRKYRPTSFADVVGQDHIVSTLESAAKQNKLAHAFLFAGSRGTGKTSVARILAKNLMTNGIEDAALKQQIAQGIETDSVVDLLEIDGASNRGIDDIRELIEKIQFSPVVARAKVYIIDEVHMLTKEAFNALLKTLEEPPRYAYFILATTELNKIPATIQSRCQCFPFRRIREEDIIRRLQYIADQEKISIDRDALRAIAHHVEGGMRDAISLLDQMRSLEKITLQEVEQRIGSTGLQYVEEVFLALADQNAEAALQVVKKLEDAGVSFESFIRQMLSTARAALRTAVENKQPIHEITTIIDTLLAAVRNLRVSPVPGIVLEAALLSLCSPTETTTDAKPTIKVETKPKAEAPVPKESAEESTEPPKPGIIEVPNLNLEAVQEQWNTVVKNTTPAAVKMSLKNGRVTAVDDKQITISFASDFHKSTVAKTDASLQVEKVIEGIFKKHIRVHCVLDTESTTNNTTDTDAVNLAEAAAEVF